MTHWVGPGFFCPEMTPLLGGAGLDEHRLPVWTLAGMPSLLSACWSAPGLRSWFKVSVSVPSALLASVNAAVRIVPAARDGAWLPEL